MQTSGRTVRPTLILLFCEEVFSRFVAAPLCRGVSGHGDRAPWLQHTNEADRSNILAPGFWSGHCRTHLSPAFTAARTTIGLWEIVSSYSSATAPVSHRISRADPLIKTRKELSAVIAACAGALKIYLKRPLHAFSWPHL